MFDPAPSEVRDHLAARADDMEAMLRRLVEIETPSDEPDSLGPMYDVLTGELAARGYRTRRRRGATTAGYLYATRPARPREEPVQLLVGHADTVWPTGTLAERPIAHEDGELRGPGIYDMKAGLVQILFALGTLDELGASPPAEPVVLINGDEEIGSRSSRRAIERLARVASRAFVLEPGLGPTGMLKTARKGLGRFTVTIQGRAAHAGLDPELGASAILELSTVIQRLFALNDRERGVTVNVGTIEGGIRPNVVAPTSQAVVDVRILHPEDMARIDDAIRGLEPTTPGTSLTVEGGFGRPPMVRTPGNIGLFKAAQKIGAELGLQLEETTAGGGSDGNTTSLHTATLDGLGAVGEGAHAPNERIVVASLVERTALLASLLLVPVDGAGRP